MNRGRTPCRRRLSESGGGGRVGGVDGERGSEGTEYVWSGGRGDGRTGKIEHGVK